MSLLNSFEELQDMQNDSVEFFLHKMVDLSSNPSFVKLKDFLEVEDDPHSRDDDFKFASRMTWFDKNVGNNNVCISAGYGNPIRTTHQYDYYSFKKNFIIFIRTINTGFKKINWNDFEMYVTMFRERYGSTVDYLWDRIYHYKENGIIMSMSQYYNDIRNLYDVELF